ncbi:YihY/virulence factor BrkB family protein [Peptoniphilus sp.]|jgi:membrane protein|uniref:YihY/virulence factor BrkB family protein n=1 Tax=Peptoniphilus sp. TaxID=1971214 RepID=UPI003D92F8D4
MNSLKNFINKSKDKPSFIFFDKLLYRLTTHDTIAYGASMTYFFVLSMFPFLIALINAVNFSGLFNAELVSLMEYLPKDVYDIVIDFLSEISESSSGSFFTISVFLGLFSASTAIYKLIKIINNAYGFKETRNYLTLRLTGLVFTIALIVMLILLSVGQVFGEIIVKTLSIYIDSQNFSLMRFYNLTKTAFPFAYMIVIFMLLYKYSPSATNRDLVTFKSVFPGAIFSSVMLIVATFGFAFYVNNFGSYNVTYGSLGGIIVFLIWLFLTSTIIIIGAEINATLYSMKHFPSLNSWPRHDSIAKDFVN